MSLTLAQVREMAEELMFRWELDGWSFGFNDRKRSLGVCYLAKKRIEVSLKLVNSGIIAEIRETILHEIAHALVGPGHKHDNVWKNMAIKVGARPEACTSEIPDRGDGAKYIAHCSCGEPHYLYRRGKRMTQLRCIRPEGNNQLLVFNKIKIQHRRG